MTKNLPIEEGKKFGWYGSTSFFNITLSFLELSIFGGKKTKIYQQP